MDLKAYCDKRKLEMLEAVQKMEAARKTTVSQGQQLQNQLNQITAQLQRYDVELEVLTKLESELTKEVPDARSSNGN